MCEFFRVDTDKVAIEDFPERQQTSFAAKKLLPGEFAIIWFVRPMLYHSPIQTLLTACVHETLKSLSSYSSKILSVQKVNLYIYSLKQFKGTIAPNSLLTLRKIF